MKPAWLFETDTFGEDCVEQLREEIVRQGMKCVYAAKVPLRSNESYLDIFSPKACVVFYGSLNFAAQIKREASWVPGVFNTSDNFLWQTYATYFKKFLLAQKFAFYSWNEVIPQKNKIYDSFGLENTIFMRPDSGEKPFSGKLINKEELETALPKLGYEVISDDTLVIISEPRNIELEWRFVVADRQVITGSRYMPMWLRLREDEDRTAQIFAQHVVDEVNWEPDRVWCLDVCRTKSGNYYVVELNSFSCSGLYSCDPKSIVEYVSRIAFDEWEKNSE